MIDQILEIWILIKKNLFFFIGFAAKKLKFLMPQISALGSYHFSTAAQTSSTKPNAPVSSTFILLFFFLFIVN
jgi:hypothetical protein